VFVPARNGSLQIQMLAAARRDGRIAQLLATDLEALFVQVQAGQTVLVMQNIGGRFSANYHNTLKAIDSVLWR